MLLCVLLLFVCFVGVMVWAIGKQLSEFVIKFEKLQK